jgi:hypothetical protein
MPVMPTWTKRCCATCSEEATYRGRVPKQKRLFEVELEANLNELAFDGKSGRMKVERALDAGRNLGADVDSAGVVWTYAATPQAEPPS